MHVRLLMPEVVSTGIVAPRRSWLVTSPLCPSLTFNFSHFTVIQVRGEYKAVLKSIFCLIRLSIMWRGKLIKCVSIHPFSSAFSMFELKKNALQTTFYPWLRWDSCCTIRAKCHKLQTVLIQINHAVHEVMTKFIHDTNWAEFFELHHLLMSSTSAIVWWHLTGEISASITGCIHLLIFAEQGMETCIN